MTRTQTIELLKLLQQGIDKHRAKALVMQPRLFAFLDGNVLHPQGMNAKDAQRIIAELQESEITVKVFDYETVNNEITEAERLTLEQMNETITEIQPEQKTKTRLREQQEPDPKPDPEPEKKPIINDWIGDDESSAPPGWRRAVASFSIYTD